MTQYDLIVIGTGHGGPCLNVGCIPAKALLHASEVYADAGNGSAAMGIKVKPELDLAAMLAFKDQGVKGNVDGVEFLLKKNKIDAVQGTGRIAGPGKVEGSGAGGQKQALETKAVPLA